MSYLLERVSDSGDPLGLVSLAEAKSFMKISYSTEDALITDLVGQVVNDMEGYMWTSLIASSYKVYASHWHGGCIPLRRGPVNAITSVQYYDESNAIQTLVSTSYFVSRGMPVNTLTRAYNVTWPAIFRRSDAVIITYTTTPLIENKVKLRAKKAIAYLFENRSNIDASMSALYKAVVGGSRRNYHY